MKLLVIQEQHFIEMPNGEVWVDQQSGREFWERYLKVFEDIVVCARMEKASQYMTQGLIQSDRQHVTFIPLPDFRGVAGLIKNLPQVIHIMRGAINSCDRVIFRAPSPISMIAYPLARISGKSYAAEIMNNPATHFSGNSMRHFYQPFIQKFIVWQTKSLCLHANGVSYVTEHVLQEMYSSRAGKYGESRNYFEGSYSTISLKDECFHYEEWPDKRPEVIYIVHTGKMEDNRKGQDVLIYTVKILNERGYNVHCIFVGDGELRGEFEVLGKSIGIDSKLEFVGWKAGYRQVQEQLLRANIAVFPSMGEGLPRSTIEAMANGLLCFGSKIDGMTELLDETLLVDGFDGRSFADKIEYYLEHWELVAPKRLELYNKSRTYGNEKLESRRNEFYKKLRQCGVNEPQSGHNPGRSLHE